jgi:hypothetical protein
VVAALTAQLILGAWWVDAIASLPIVWLSFEKDKRLGKDRGAAGISAAHVGG